MYFYTTFIMKKNKKPIFLLLIIVLFALGVIVYFSLLPPPETEWQRYYKTALTDPLWLRNTVNCDKDSEIVKSTADSLRAETPQMTPINFVQYIQSNVPYDKEMYNNIIVNGLDYFYGVPKASNTINTKKGICRQQAQLFVSLARAEGMPSRIVMVWAEQDCSLFDLTCYGLNFLRLLGLAPYNHSIAQVWMFDHWDYVDATNGLVLGTTLPSNYKTPQIMTTEQSYWGC